MDALDQSSSDSSVHSTLKCGRPNPRSNVDQRIRVEVGADPAVVLQRYNIAIFIDHILSSLLILGAFTRRPSLESQSLMIIGNVNCLSSAPIHSKKSENRWITDNV